MGLQMDVEVVKVGLDKVNGRELAGQLCRAGVKSSKRNQATDIFVKLSNSAGSLYRRTAWTKSIHTYIYTKRERGRE